MTKGTQSDNSFFATLLSQQREVLRASNTFEVLIELLAKHALSLTGAAGVAIEMVDRERFPNEITAGQKFSADAALTALTFRIQNETHAVGAIKVFSHSANAFSLTIQNALQLLIGFYATPFSQAARPSEIEMSKRRHEVFNTLGGVVGMTNLLIETGVSKEQEEFAEILKSSCDEVLRQLKDIFQLMKEDAPTVNERVDFYMEHLLKNVESTLAFEFAKKKIQFIQNIESDLSNFQFHGDASRLSELLCTIAKISIETVQEGYVAIAVTGHRISDKVMNLSFEVIDTGTRAPSHFYQKCETHLQKLGSELTYIAAEGGGHSHQFTVALMIEERSLRQAA